MEYKQAIIVRVDISMSLGKTAAQCSHASVESAFKVNKTKPRIFGEWRRQGMKKVVLKVKSERELIQLMKKADKLKIKNALITDAGHTELSPGTVTCLGIGPDKDEIIDKVTGTLQSL